MCRDISRLTAITALILLANTPSAAQRPAESQRVFTGDERLKKPLTLHQRLVTIDEALALARDVTSVRLRAAPSIEHDNVIILVTERPVAEVLEVLAAAHGCRWVVDSREAGRRGYLLVPSDSTERRAAVERVEHRRASMNVIADECQARMAAAAIPEKNVSARLDEIQRALAQADTLPEERQRLLREQTWLKSRPDFGYYAILLKVFLRLLPGARERLMRGETVLYSSARAEGMDPLPDWEARTLFGERAASPDWLEWALASASPLDQRLRLRVHWHDRAATLVINDEVVGPFHPGYEDRQQFVVTVPLPPPTERAINSGEVSEPRLRARVRLSLLPKTPTSSDPATCYPATTLSDLLACIHRQKPEIGFVGDAYLRKLDLDGVAAVTPVEDLVERGAATSGSHWSWDERGYVVVKSLTACDERPVAIPASTLRALCARAEHHHGLELMDYAWFAAQLSEAQMDAWFSSLSPGPTLVFRDGALNRSSLQRCYYDLRFLATLSEEQQAPLLSGQPLQGSQLTPLQQGLLQQALNGNTDEPGASTPIEYIPGRVIPACSVRLVRESRETLNGPAETVQFAYSARGQRLDVPYRTFSR